MGKPDLLIAFTCNPKWPEIKDLLFPNKLAKERYDIIARVFCGKQKIFKRLLTSGQIFGETTIEWQK